MIKYSVELATLQFAIMWLIFPWNLSGLSISKDLRKQIFFFNSNKIWIGLDCDRRKLKNSLFFGI